VASKTLVLLEDDIDGGVADESLRFAFDGKSYVIDLSAKNAAKFRKAVAPYVDSARREGSLAKSYGRTKSNGYSDVDPKAVRAWAQSNGYEISTRGRVSGEIVAAFKAAGN
jgi:hypothetical protein